MEGRSALMILSAVLIIRCSLDLSCFVDEPNHTEMDEDRTDWPALLARIVITNKEYDFGFPELTGVFSPLSVHVLHLSAHGGGAPPQVIQRAKCHRGRNDMVL
ncbi:hypothetical protein ILYODFUR_029431 [Ilyodon furcidens]|uniref:Uncharacterized protein n=1 Tax=Ilyodon furcidens TaxID=33524 RepID=A0ABV0TNW4_9TELE